VPHISLVFREMWDTTNLNLTSPMTPRKPGDESSEPRKALN
jgi:hypothetical protein